MLFGEFNVEGNFFFWFEGSSENEFEDLECLFKMVVLVGSCDDKEDVEVLSG